ncbi:ArsR family transcriptional regulator [Halorarum salinum]|uniref:ArsR family transcriptional regulator n=1 Tax=Halorarum salinum TaxID=2743089 RepID=A0A7D5QEY9_9EURY|nr:ArsR family transcriptional regulator [Halobaculum salinum]QLG60244.1 ArsR family transcriptional regulator [Halobaculum salinum]
MTDQGRSSADPAAPRGSDDPRTGAVGLDELLTSLSHRTRRSILLTLAADNPRDEEEFTSPDADEGDDASDEDEFASADFDAELFEAKVRYEHLPQLDRAGLIEWNREADTVTRGPNFEELRPLVDLINEHRDEFPDDWL